MMRRRNYSRNIGCLFDETERGLSVQYISYIPARISMSTNKEYKRAKREKTRWCLDRLPNSCSNETESYTSEFSDATIV